MQAALKAGEEEAELALQKAKAHLQAMQDKAEADMKAIHEAHAKVYKCVLCKHSKTLRVTTGTRICHINDNIVIIIIIIISFNVHGASMTHKTWEYYKCFEWTQAPIGC